MARTILLVDDERDSLEPMRILLEEHYNVLTAESGKEALLLFEQEKIEIVIADQRMPGMTGVELLTRVKEIYPGIVRVILTAYTDVQTMTRAINEGRVYRYIIKPWNVDDMHLVIRQALEWKDLMSDKGQLNADLAEAHGTLLERTRQLENANEAVINHEKLAAVGRFAAEMLHEMNNCVQGIMVVNNSLALVVQKQMEELKELEFQTQNLTEVASLIRSFAQGAALPYFPMLSNPFEPAMNVMRVLKRHPDFKNISVKLAHGEVPDWIMDTRQLKHVLLNLLKNAAKASKKGQEITIDIQSKEKELLYHVIDHGRGVPEKMRERIFEPFFTVSNQSGTGLGLSICKQVADMHNGRIECKETPGGGATFTFIIPKSEE